MVRTFLEHSLVARIATRSEKGRPALTPLWFVWDQGRLHFATGLQTLAARNAAGNPNVVVLLDAEGRGRSAHVLRLRGRATVHSGSPSPRVLAQLGRKYYLAGWHSELAHVTQWPLRMRYYAQSDAATIEVAPDEAELLHRPEA